MSCGSAKDWRIFENEEFVRVEKVEGAYFIKTSPYPFRPDRGIYRSDRGNDSRVKAGNSRASRCDEVRKTKVDHSAKFTYFLNPDPQTDLTNYKMSRKDKKHSETYHERMKRKQRDLEASVTTITTISRREKSIEGVKAIETSSRCVKSEPVDDESAERVLGISRHAPIKKSSTLLRKIREKSKRKKRRAPRTPLRTQISYNANLEERTEKGNKRSCSNIDSRDRNNDDWQTCGKVNLERDEKRKSRYDKSSFNERENISDLNRSEQESQTGGFKGVSAKDSRMENRNKQDEIVREQINKFDQQANLKKLKKIRECKNDTSKLARSASYDRNALRRNHLKDHLKDTSREVPRSTTNREVFTSFSLDNIRNGSSDLAKSSVSEKVRSFEKIKGNTGDRVRRADHMRSERKGGLGAVKREFALSADQIRSNEGKQIISRAEMLNAERQQRVVFKSFSSGNCIDPSLNPRGFGRLPANVSFLHSYKKQLA